MLKIAITVNPNKDKNLANTIKLLDILEEYLENGYYSSDNDVYWIIYQ